MTELVRNLRYTARGLARAPGFSVTVVLTLALAIGANATVFSIIDAFLLRPLPYPEADRLVMVYNTYPGLGLEIAGTSIPDYLDRRERARSLESLAIVSPSPRALAGDGAPEQVLVTRASPSLFDVLRIAPQLGRVFTEPEAVPGADRVVVLSDALWRTRFGAASDIVGRDIRLDGIAHRVVGVMPSGFGFPNRDVDAWVPFAFTAQQMSDQERGNEFSMSVGRLRPGATIEQLDAEMDAIVRANLEQGRFDDEDAPRIIESIGFTGRAVSLRERRSADVKPMLLTLQATVLAVLLIACANVTNLQLARVAARRRELSVRAALGANRGRLAGLVVAESLLLALLGGAVGLAVAQAGLALVRWLRLDPANLGIDLGLDVTVLGFTFVAVLLAALLSALLPLANVLRDDLIRSVQAAARGRGGEHGAHRLRSALVVLQLAASLALLVGAGLLTRSFLELQGAGVGFDSTNVWTARVALPQPRYADRDARARFFGRALESLGALPGVSEAGFTSVLPFGGQNSQGSVAVDGYTPPLGGSPPHAQQRSISEGFLPTLGIPVVRGRNFAAIETERVAIVNETMARAYWPNADALGQRIRNALDPADQWYTIVGIVPPLKHASLAESSTDETVYWHYRQRPAVDGVFALRTALPVESISRSAAAALAGIDRDIPLFDVRSMNARIADSLGPQRAPMVLMLVFAGSAFMLAVIGIYGVLSWAVTRRIGEIGIRMALGAEGADIVRMILRQGGRLIVLGLGLGAAAAVVLARSLASQIYHVSALDPAVFATAVVGLAGAAVLASWLPARRAARVDPASALAEE